VLSIRYLCALLAGVAIAAAAFSVGVEVVAPVAADEDPFAVFAGGQLLAESQIPERFDDGLTLAGGAFVTCPEPVPIAVTLDRSVQHRPAAGNGWWTRGPVRRVVSFPVRCLIGKRAGGR